MMASDLLNERRRTSTPGGPTALKGELKPLEIPRAAWTIPPVASRHLTQGFLLAVIISAFTIIVLGILSQNKILGQHALNQILGITLACLALFVFQLPILSYILDGQGRKRNSILTYYTPELIRMYILHWRPCGFTSDDQFPEKDVLSYIAGTDITDEDVKRRFEEMLKEYFGYRRFILPVILLSAVSTVVLSIACSSGLALASGGEKHFPLGLELNIVSIAGIAGAYTWVTWDAVTKFHQNWLHPADLFWYAGRFVIAVPIGHAIAVYAGSDTEPAAVGWGAAAAFVVGIFSLDAIMARLDALGSRALNLREDPNEGDDLVMAVPGIGRDTSSKLKIEGITTASQLANADPIRLSLVTSMSIGYILEIVDRAILFGCAKEFLGKLQGIGWTRASDVLIKPLPESREDIERISSKVKVEGLDISRLSEKLEADDRVKFISKARTCSCSLRYGIGHSKRGGNRRVRFRR
jgi:hypothetical protein